MEMIFIIGAARSGTHFVASTIANSIDNCTYVNEINEFWTKRNRFRTTDYIDDNIKNDPKMIIKFREDFIKKYSNDSNIIVEKTAANCLRVDFIAKVFPDAKFVYVDRDRSSVIRSVERKLEGDFRKITKNQLVKPSAMSRIAFALSRSVHKIILNVRSPIVLFKNIAPFFGTLVTILGFSRNPRWGPRIMNNSKSLKEYVEQQYDECVSQAINELSGKQYIVVNYEQIINNPNEVEKKLSSFLKITNINFKVR